MLKITDYNDTQFKNGIDISEAEEVRVTYEINGARTLDFTYPENDKSHIIRENRIVICEGQAYRIMKARSERGEKSVLHVNCSHVFNADAPAFHIQNMPDMIGVNPTDVIARAIRGTRFSLLSDSELSALGMKRVGYDGFLTDYFSEDKTNPYDVIKTLIESCGKGELYADNYKIALVEKIGRDTAARLDLSLNMGNITVERDISDMVTRFYPYGRDDIHIGSVNSGRQYIDSENASVYGIRCGYRDFSDITEPGKLLRRARWELDADNNERIDIPEVNITGGFCDVQRLIEGFDSASFGIGDGVTVIDGENELYERIIKIEYYPYSPKSAVVSIGRVKKDMFFYLEQMGRLSRRYKKVSTSSGKVKASAVSGTIKNSSVISQSIITSEISIGQNKLTTDDEGKLLLNGEKLIKDKEENEDEQNI